MGLEVAISYRMVKETVSRKTLSPEMTWHVQNPKEAAPLERCG